MPIISQNDFIKKISSYLGDNYNEQRIRDAYDFATQAHSSMLRKSGEPYIVHPIAVSILSAETLRNEDAVSAALLHDVVEDTQVTLLQIKEKFGEKVESIVSDLTKLDTLEKISDKENFAENLKKLLLATDNNLSSLIIKLADRMDNTLTIEHLPKHRQLRYCQENLTIFAPLAGKMGMQSWRETFESISFKVCEPEEYNHLYEKLKNKREDMLPTVKMVDNKISELIKEKNLSAEIIWREKKIYSIYKKMMDRKITFYNIKDIYAFRLITENIETCYSVLGLIHNCGNVVTERFKDYISTPKQNGYESIHTTVSLTSGFLNQKNKENKKPNTTKHAIVEFQIRTKHMHKVAELGVAAHGIYKQKNNQLSSKESKVFQWFRDTLNAIEDSDDAVEIFEDFKKTLAYDKIFCFTPKGDVVSLPKGSSIIDFAIAIHTNVGLCANDAKIDGQPVKNLGEKIENGVTIEIMRQPEYFELDKKLIYATTGKSKLILRNAKKQLEKKEQIIVGEKIIKEFFKSKNKIYKKPNILKNFIQENKKNNLTNLNSLFVAIENQSIKVEDVFFSIYPKEVEQPTHPSVIRKILKQMNLSITNDNKKITTNLWYSNKITQPFEFRRKNPQNRLRIKRIILPKNNTPVPPELVVGIIYPKDLLTVHIFTQMSDTLKKLKKNNTPCEWLETRWQYEHLEEYKSFATIKIRGVNKIGLLNDIAQTAFNNNANIASLILREENDDISQITMVLNIKNLIQLKTIIKHLSSYEKIISIGRRII